MNHSTIKFTCKCGRSLKAGRGAAGKAVKCPACGARVLIPAPSPGGSADPAPASEAEENPFAFDAAPPAATGREVQDAASKDPVYGTPETSSRFKVPIDQKLLAALPEEVRGLGKPKASFPATGSETLLHRIAPFLLGLLLLAELLVGGLILFIPDARDSSPDWAWLLLLVGTPLTVGGLVAVYWYEAWLRKRLVLLYDFGFVHLHGERWELFRWDAIARVRFKATRVFVGAVFAGTEFVYTVQGKDGTEIRLTHHYLGIKELGQTIMEQASRHGALCMRG